MSTETTIPPEVQAKYDAARAEAKAKYPAHVIEAGGLIHYVAGLSQALHAAIIEGDWSAVAQIAEDPYLDGDDLDKARGALAGSGRSFLEQPEVVTELGRAKAAAEQLARIAGVEEPPPSTVRELRQVLIDYDASRPRSMQTALGPSEWGSPCQQQIARKLAGAPRRPTLEPNWAPFLGTAGHAEMETGVLPFWNAQLGEELWLAEDELLIAPDQDGIPGVRGHGDAFRLGYDMVVDWKFVSGYALDKLRAARRAGKPPAEQISTEYRVQAHSYGKGHARKGRKVRWVRLVFFARTSSKYDDSEEWTEAYDESVADQAAERYFDTARMVRELDLEGHPDQIAGVPASPGEACTFCPFHRPDRGVTTWESCSGAAGSNPGVEAMARLRRQALLNEVKTAKSVDELVALWERESAVGRWTDEATAAAKAKKAALLAA